MANPTTTLTLSPQLEPLTTLTNISHNLVVLIPVSSEYLFHIYLLLCIEELRE